MIGTFLPRTVSCLILLSSPALAADVLSRFIEIKEAQYRQLAAAHGMDVTDESTAFFDAAERSDTNAVEELLKRLDDPARSDDLLFPILYETRGTISVFGQWDEELREEYARELLAYLPDPCVFFAGTAPARFIVTAYAAVEGRTNLLIVTQNGLHDERYLGYLRATLGETLTIPSPTNESNGSSPQEMMSYKSDVARQVFDANKASHNFYFEESFVAPWTFPLLEPRGPIMKLNTAPVDFTDVMIESERAYWDARVAELRANSKFAQCYAAREAYTQLRVGIGGVYASRRDMREAEYAYRQGVELFPESAYANFRLSDLLLLQNRFDEAVELMREFKKYFPEPERIDKYIREIQTIAGSGP